jgi:MerR family transcriptional regulator, light-induced transcriptional regulator
MDPELSSTYSISDLEKLSGIKAHTIRIWEKRYGIISPGRTGTNIRYYTNEDLKKLLNISLLHQHGYKISDISSMSAGELSAKVASVAMAHSDNREKRLLLSLLEMDEPLFTRVFADMVAEEGFEEAVVRVVFPFFRQIGIMWQVGTINPAQEHFFSNLIRAKIIAATDLLIASPADAAATAVLFLPEDELHEIALLFYNYAFRKRGYKTIYLGQSVPYESLTRIYSISNPAIVVTSITNPVLPETFASICKKICAQATQATVYFTGPVPDPSATDVPGNARFIGDLRKLLGL